jgi:hypothetical protein
MTSYQGEAAGRLLQIAAVFLMALICAVVLHKGVADISLLVQDYSGQKFWVALAKYFLRNLAGGAGADA